MSYRCDSCGNKTRFDVEETKRIKAFHHFSLAGEDSVEEEEIISREIEKVTCRWCGSTADIVEESPLDAGSRENV